ncbi:MAG: endo-1,4-beta-xylanase [Defluviitaleaceae bacterium]|nr:endo-1,4-beta-xylanase [Defluviitaleaceae bacterium]
MRKPSKKRWLAFMLAAVMALGLVGMTPARALAEDNGNGGEVIWSLLGYTRFTNLGPAGTANQVLTGAPVRFQNAGGTVGRVAGNPLHATATSIQINRTADWHGLDLHRAPLNMTPPDIWTHPNLHTIEVIGRTDPGASVRIQGHQGPWGYIGAKFADSEGNFNLVSRPITPDDHANASFANSFRITGNSSGGEHNIIIHDIIVRNIGPCPDWQRPPGGPPPAWLSEPGPTADGDVLRIETPGGGIAGAQVPVSALGITPGNLYGIFVDLLVPSATPVDIQIALQTGRERNQVLFTSEVFRSHPGFHDPTFTGPAWRRYWAELDLRGESELNFNNFQIATAGPNADRGVIFRVDNFTVVRVGDGIVTAFDFEDGAGPFFPLGNAALETRANVETRVWHTISFEDGNWEQYQDYIHATNEDVMSGARVMGPQRNGQPNYAWRQITELPAVFTSSLNKSMHFNLPVPIPVGAHVEVSWDVFVPTSGNNPTHLRNQTDPRRLDARGDVTANPAQTNVAQTQMVAPGLVVNRFAGSAELQPTNFGPPTTTGSPGPTGVDTARRIPWDTWVTTTTRFDVTSFVEPVTTLYFRHRADAASGNNQPHLAYIDNIVITVTIADEPYIPTWDAKLAAPSLAGTFADYFVVGQILEPPLLLDDDLMGAFMHHYVSVTAENAMKPDTISGGAGLTTRPQQLFLDNARTMVERAEDYNLHIVGHALVWHEQSSIWLHGSTPIGYLTRAEAMDNLRWFIHQYAGYFTCPDTGVSRVHAWDVANEVITSGGGDESAAMYATAFGHPVPPASHWSRRVRAGVPWFRAFSNGADFGAGERGWDYIYYSFVFAREAAPSALLIVNDFNDEMANKRDALAGMTEYFNDRWHRDAVNNPAFGNASHPDYGRLLIEAIGMQAHYNNNNTTAGQISANNVRDALVRYAQTGARVHVTELDVHFQSPMAGQGGWMTQAQLQSQATFFGNLFAHYLDLSNYLDRVTFWGRDDMSSWRSSGAPTLFDRHLNPKPAFNAVINAASTHVSAPVFRSITGTGAAQWTLRPGQAGVPYTAAVVAGGRPSPALSVVAGNLPDGLNLSPTGTLSGTPREHGTFSFTVSAVNSHGTIQQTYTVTIEPPAFVAAEISLNMEEVVIPCATIGAEDDIDRQVAVTVTHVAGTEELNLYFENLNGFIVTPSNLSLSVGGNAEFTVEPGQAMLDSETPQVFETVISVRYAGGQLASLPVSFEIVEGDEPVCREDLGAAIKYVDELTSGDFTRLSWALMHQVYMQAVALYNNAQATAQELEDMTSRLWEAIESLVSTAPPPLPPVNKGPLVAAIEYAEVFVVSDFSRLNWVLLQDALNHARAVVGNENATQVQVNAALERLNTAIANRIN